MNVPTNLFMWIMACLPIIVLLLLMIKFQWGATEAAPVGLAITIITGIVFYKADIRLLAAESAKGIWSALIILLIVWTAILLYQVADEARAFLVIRNGMRKLLPNELLMVLALGWILESFLQGITGFGVPVAVGAPLLMGIGVVPVFAVIIPLLGQAWGNTFGTLAAAWDALAMSTGLVPGTPDYLAAAFWAGVFIWMWNVVIGLVICWFYGKGKAVRKGLPALLILSLGFPSLITEVSSGIVIIVFNVIILGLKGNVGVAAYGVIANLSLVVISIFTGIAQGMQPLISSAYGRGDSARIRGILRYGLAAAVFISLTLYAGICWGAAPITAVFNSENNLKLQEIAEYGLRLYFTGIPAAGLNIILSIFFTSTEQAVPAHIISLLRGLVLIIPIAFFLSGLWGMTGVWLAFPATELVCALTGAAICKRFYSQSFSASR